MSRSWRAAWPTPLLLAAAWPAPAVPQAVRASGVTRIQYVDIRPLAEDSVPVQETSGEGLLRRSADGHVVRCVEGASFCHFRQSVDAVSLAPVSQDVVLSVWGIGRGVRAYGHVRGRTVMGGGSDIWARPDDHFDALAAFVELERPRFRVRAGRQWSSSGLGFYNFDGAAVLVRAVAGLALEAYGGRSLLRGVSEPRTGGALEAVDPFAPEEGGLLVGATARWRPGSAFALGLEYQRDVREDRRGLYSERVAADALWRAGLFEVAGALERDFATSTTNELRVDLRARFGSEFGAGVLARRYRPFFEAWTIWGAFDPVAFDEVGARGWWRPARLPLTVEGGTAWRGYEDTGASETFGSVRSSGWRLNGSAAFRPVTSWVVHARGGVDVGFGAAGTDGSVRVEREFEPDAHLAASLLAFQRLYEFRVTEGTVWGLGVDGGLRLGPRARAAGGVTWYFHAVDDGGPDADWNQVRGSLMLEWVVGAEPGRAPGVR
ncbi:MAG TPA: hypothetical protein VMM12_02295 [Longimicrobiales bacterium]|nr:hypothetical protein [Longimicrobiales bacterium]